MRLVVLLLFCVIAGCFFVLGAYCSPLSPPSMPPVLVVVPDERPADIMTSSPCEPPARCEQQVGTLTTLKEGSSENRVLPLFANKSWANRDRFFYSARTDGFNPLVVPVYHKGRNCMTDRIGCETLYDGDTVHVPAFGESKTFAVSLYQDLY